MSERERFLRATEQMLGSFETVLLGQADPTALLEPGDPVFLRPTVEGNASAVIRVQDRQGRAVGNLPSEQCAWLAPLLLKRQIRIDAYLPRENPIQRQWQRTVQLGVTTFDIRLITESTSGGEQDGWHSMVVSAYRQAAHCQNASAAQAAYDAVQPLADKPLLPETRLLLAVLPGLVAELHSAHIIAAQALLHGQIDELQIGEPLSCQALTLFPLAWTTPREPIYLLLSTAIEQNLATVEEVNKQGMVSFVRLINRGDSPLLLPEGEVLIGAKQNRVVNLTVMVAADSTLLVPVSCVEQGRWSYKSRRFRPGGYAPPSLRAAKLKAVEADRVERNAATGDQHAVWENISAALNKAKIHSPTASLIDGMDAVEDPERATPPRLPEGTAGVLAVRQGQILGLDLFDTATSFDALWPRLSKAYLFDAHIERRDENAAIDSQLLPKFLRGLADRARILPKPIGIGNEIAISCPDLVGTGILFADRICHVSAFVPPVEQ